MAKSSEWWKMQAKIEKQKEYCKKIFSYCGNLDDDAGIYVFYRTDDLGNKKCYIGQAKHLLTRVNQHVNSTRYEQHIDKSIRKYGLASKNNFIGWRLRFYKCLEEDLDEKEKYYIQHYLDHNYELYNVESGGQDKGHVDLNYRAAVKGYREGVDYGYSKAIKDVKEYFDKYLDYQTKSDASCFKKPNKLGEVLLKEIYIKKYDEFKELLENEQIH